LLFGVLKINLSHQIFMNRIFLLLLFFFSLLTTGYGQKTSFIVSGYVQDAASGERLPGAVIYCPVTTKGAQTNHYGFFSLPMNSQSNLIEVSYIGFQTKAVGINGTKDTFLIVNLEKKGLEIDEVIVSSQKTTRSLQRLGQHRLPTSQIEKIPMVLGETDLLKAYQMLPGVQSGIEGTAGMVVRGSDPGQNLILLDGVPVYNASHLFGLFSVFDTDAIKSSTLIKGAFPARYGGRVSSVLDIRMKEGNNQELKGVVSIGLISSKIMLEGPIIKGKTSFLVSARRTYIDLLSYPYQRLLNGKDALWKYNFHDLNLKLNHIANDKNRFYLSIYNGMMFYSFSAKYCDFDNTLQSEEKNGFNWGNLTATFRWNYQPGRRLFCNTTLIYSQYVFSTHSYTKLTDNRDFTGKSSVLDLNFNSGIVDYGTTIDFEYMLKQNHQLRFGALFTHHRFMPGVNIVDFNDLGGLLKADTINNSKDLYDNEFATYLESEWNISTEWMLQAGLRCNSFFTDTKTYLSIEPRIFLKYMPSSRSWFGLAYSRTSQNIHLLTNSSVGFPTDQWMPITDRVKPTLANQYNLSYNQGIGDSYSFSTELFYKDMDNVIEYRENANLKNDWQDIVEQGKGEVYGIELLLNKEKGKLTGWIAYTLSKSDRIFSTINDGIVFPYKYDRRHDFKIVMMYPLGKRVDVGINWVFTTGNAVTLPLERTISATSLDNLFYGYEYSWEVYTYNQKNNFRMPNYQRLDITFNLHKRLRHFDRTLSFGMYNVYARQNALYYDFFEGKLRSNSYITYMPSINYTLRF